MQTIKVLKCANREIVHNYKIIISLIWISGLLIGRFITMSIPWTFISAESFIMSSPVYPGGVLAVVSTMVIGGMLCIVNHRIFYVFILLKAIIYSVVSMNIMIACGDAGWLVRILLLSTDTAFVLILLMFSFRSIGRQLGMIKKNAAVAAVISAILVSLDTYFTIPLATSLLNS